MAVITHGSVIAASTRSGAPQRGRRLMSMSKKAAQTLRPRHLGARGRRPRLGALAHRCRCRRRPEHNEAAMARIRGEQAVKPNEMTARARHQRRQASDEVQRLEQDVGGPIAKRVLELVDHQPVAVAAETLTRNGRARHIAAQTLQLSAIAGLAGDGRIEREAVPRSGEWLRRLPPRPVERGVRGVQAKRLASRDGADGNPVAHGGALELRERILTIGVEVEPELLLVVILLRDQRAVSKAYAKLDQ